MNHLIKIFVFFLSSFFLLLLPQAKDNLEKILAAGFVVFSILVFFLSKKLQQQPLAQICRSYLTGMHLALLLLTICIFFPVGGFLAQPLYLQHSDENAEAILVLASGANLANTPNLSGYQRVLHGIKLLKENRAPLLMISTGFSADNGFAESAWVASLTSLCEVQPEKMQILVSERIKTSKTEADYATERLNELGIKKVLLVTSGSHLYRCKLVFENLGIQVLPAPCHSAKGLYYSMGHDLRSFDATVHEWLGLIYYRLRKFF